MNSRRPGAPHRATARAKRPTQRALLWPGSASASPPIDEAARVPADDDTHKSRIFAFQLARDLEPDGLPDPLTLIQLNRAAGIGEPRLKDREAIVTERSHKDHAVFIVTQLV